MKAQFLHLNKFENFFRLGYMQPRTKERLTNAAILVPGVIGFSMQGYAVYQMYLERKRKQERLANQTQTKELVTSAASFH